MFKGKAETFVYIATLENKYTGKGVSITNRI